MGKFRNIKQQEWYSLVTLSERYNVDIHPGPAAS